jgi:DNA modification methylase
MIEPYYEDDLVTLYHGDCREIREWIDADVLVTDPPYGVGHRRFSKTTENPVSMAGEVKAGHSATRVLTPEQTRTRDSALALWGGKPALVFGTWRAPRPTGTQLRLIWDKQIKQGVGGVGPFRPGDEEIYLLGWPNPLGAKRGPVASTVLRHQTWNPAAKDRPRHPTPKPVPLMTELIEHCPPGVIADPFAGSGATLLAARDLGRSAIGVEVEERYCELIASRLSAIQDGAA